MPVEPRRDNAAGKAVPARGRRIGDDRRRAQPPQRFQGHKLGIAWPDAEPEEPPRHLSPA